MMSISSHCIDCCFSLNMDRALSHSQPVYMDHTPVGYDFMWLNALSISGKLCTVMTDACQSPTGISFLAFSDVVTGKLTLYIV